jgi:hypothetical protein
MISRGLPSRRLPSWARESYPNNYMDLSLNPYMNQAIPMGRGRKEVARLL